MEVKIQQISGPWRNDHPNEKIKSKEKIINYNYNIHYEEKTIKKYISKSSAIISLPHFRVAHEEEV